MKSFSPDLASRLEKIFSPEEMDSLREVFTKQTRPTTLRVNLLTSSLKEICSKLSKARISYELLNFPENCLVLDSNFSEKDLWKLDIYKEGKIYIQGISSQIPVHIFSSTSNQAIPHPQSPSLKERDSIRILDACAAPGGKTSQLAALYPDAEIWAFEPQKIRFEKMQHNLRRLGCLNIKAIYDSIENISEYIADKEYFDMILIDAPCSGEGSLNFHNEKFLKNWSLKHIKKNNQRQKNICDAVIPYLKVGGEMIYSTCTIAPEENEAIIHNILCHYPEMILKKIDILENKYIKPVSALKNFEKYYFKKEISEQCIRVIPSEFSEGFFISKFRKGLK